MLPPPNLEGARPFGEPPVPEAIEEITPRVRQPTQKECSPPVEMAGVFVPGEREGLVVAETAAVDLRRGVIVGVHDDGLGAINDAVALLLAPARVFVVLGVLQFFQET